MPLNSFSSVSVVVGCASGWGASLSVVVLGLLGLHSGWYFYQYVGSSACAFFNQQHGQWRWLCGQCLHNLVGVAFLVEIHHQSWQWFERIGNGSVVVGELGAAWCPYGQLVLQFVFAIFNPLAQLSHARFVAHFEPFLFGGWCAGCSVSVSYAGECLVKFLTVVVHSR